MKRILCMIITVVLIFTTTDTALAKKHRDDNKKNDKNYEQNDDSNDDEQEYKNDDSNDDEQEYKNYDSKDDKQEFKIDDSPVIKYGRYKLPIGPITKGMGATVAFDKDTAVLTVVKDTTRIVISFKEKTVYVNGIKDDNSGIFTAKENKKMTVLIKYIAGKLGFQCDVDDDEIVIDVPGQVNGLDVPTNVTVMPVGATVLANTLNSTTLYMTASAKITAGQATGGRAELYVGSIKVATDSYITATDTSVTFTTSDDTPTNAELQSIIPKGGVVSVKLYNANNTVVTSAVGNPTLTVDYVVPTITGIISAAYNASGNQIKLNVTGASAIGDKVDVTKITLTDAVLGRTYQLTSNSSGVISSANLIEINLGSTDKLCLAGFGSSSTYLTLAIGSLLRDAAGNVSPGFTTTVTIPISVVTALDLPTNVTVAPVGTTVIANTLNSTTQYLTAAANIIAGQATGGRAELYVGNRLVSVDSYIGASDTTVTFNTSDGSPTNAELQAVIPAGGVVTVKLYNVNGNSVTSAVGNPTLIVDYAIPTITSITSVIYNVPSNQLYLIVTGAGAVGDKVDVTKITLYDASLGRDYQLTNNATTGSNGTVNSSTSILINIGSVDKVNLTGFGTTTVYLTVSTSNLLYDTAGNISNVLVNQTIPVTVIK